MNTFSNTIYLVGTLCTKPGIETSQEGIKRVEISLSTHDNYQNSAGTYKKQTQYHQLVFWNQQAIKANNKLKKGDEILVFGLLEYTPYYDQTNVQHFKTRIVSLSFKKLNISSPQHSNIKRTYKMNHDQ